MSETPTASAVDHFADALRRARSASGKPPYTLRELAKLLDVSLATAKRAVKVETHGSIELRHAVLTKTISIGAAAVLADIPHPKQVWALSLPANQRRLFVRALRSGETS